MGIETKNQIFIFIMRSVLDCGIDFDWNFFGMTLTDCINLTNSLKIPHVSKTLTSLKLQSSGIDDEKSRLICSALLENGTIRKLGKTIFFLK